MYLLDTNIISEPVKARPDPKLIEWYGSVVDSDLFLSVLTIGEIRKGIEQKRSASMQAASRLEVWLGDLQALFSGRILHVDDQVAEEWGRLQALRSQHVIDQLIAATAKVHGLTLVTRNVRHVEGLGVPVLDPFETS